MNDDKFGRTLSAWLQEEAGHRVPDHLAEALVQTAATRQRAWWSSLERLLPMTTTTMSGRVAAGRPGMFLAMIALLLVAIAGVALIAGSVRQTPTPFGLADNGRIYVADGSSIRSFAADGSDPQVLDVETGLEVSALAVSPDGARLAFATGSSGATDIKVVSLADGTTTTIPGPYAMPPEPIGWSPDGRSLTFTGLDAQGGQERLYVVAADGTGDLTTPGAEGIAADQEMWMPSYSPDGEWIAFMVRPPEVSQAPVGQIFVMHPDGSDLHPVASGVGNPGGTWAPDASVQRLLYPTSVGQTIVDLPGEQRTTFEGSGWASWSPDGKQIAYWQDRPVVVRTEDALRGAVNPVPVFEAFAGACSDQPASHAVCSSVGWSPDGTHLIGTDVAGGALLIASSDGIGDPVRVPLQFTPDLDIHPVWQPIR